MSLASLLVTKIVFLQLFVTFPSKINISKKTFVFICIFGPSDSPLARYRASKAPPRGQINFQKYSQGLLGLPKASPGPPLGLHCPELRPPKTGLGSQGLPRAPSWPPRCPSWPHFPRIMGPQASTKASFLPFATFQNQGQPRKINDFQPRATFKN